MVYILCPADTNFPVIQIDSLKKKKNKVEENLISVIQETLFFLDQDCWRVWILVT